ncbi:MAG TPA: hypothetical protein P5342_02760, partial [Candidatus Cloacimonadota bacterium]|nr:hypothetical protein [Candidatus Cloacimonadota bacterium]
MHAGLPIIGSDIPSIRELVDDSVGWLVRLNDHDMLVSTMIDVASDPSGAMLKGTAAAKKVVQISDYNSMITSYRNIYEGKSDA